MGLVLTLVAADAHALHEAMALGLDAVASTGRSITETAILGDGAVDIFAEGDDPAKLRAHAERAFAGQPVDFCVQTAGRRAKRLLVADMDSTIIGCECLDELADFAGLKDEIAAITAAAMAGELDFEGALRRRVAMLAGLGVTALRRTYDDRVRLNAGARTLVRTMAAHGARCVLVSGGFDFFTSRVAAAAGFVAHRANRLIEADGVLTGQVAEPILGRQAKLDALRQEAAAQGLEPSDTLAVGDGANDLAMIEAAGLGVAYRAKPIVAARAQARIDHADLSALLYFQGYGADRFVE